VSFVTVKGLRGGVFAMRMGPPVGQSWDQALGSRSREEFSSARVRHACRWMPVVPHRAAGPDHGHRLADVPAGGNRAALN
jgi:hypothetical protein